MFKRGGENRLRVYKRITTKGHYYLKDMSTFLKQIISCKHFNRILQIKIYIFSNNKLLNRHVAKFKFKNTEVSLSCLEWFRYKRST